MKARKKLRMSLDSHGSLRMDCPLYYCYCSRRTIGFGATESVNIGIAKYDKSHDGPRLRYQVFVLDTAYF